MASVDDLKGYKVRVQATPTEDTLFPAYGAQTVHMRDALRTAESSQRGYLVTANEIYLAPYDSAKAAAQRYLAKLTQNVDSRTDHKPMSY